MWCNHNYPETERSYRWLGVGNAEESDDGSALVWRPSDLETKKNIFRRRKKTSGLEVNNNISSDSKRKKKRVIDCLHTQKSCDATRRKPWHSRGIHNHRVRMQRLTFRLAMSHTRRRWRKKVDREWADLEKCWKTALRAGRHTNETTGSVIPIEHLPGGVERPWLVTVLHRNKVVVSQVVQMFATINNDVFLHHPAAGLASMKSQFE